LIIEGKVFKSVTLRFYSLRFFGLGTFWGSGWVESVDYDLISVFQYWHVERWCRAKRGSLCKLVHSRQRLGTTFRNWLPLAYEIMEDFLLWDNVPIVDGLT